ncbi:multidrug efflux system protein [Legionella beliardensis]|uniref:Multidrug efflux system protein n=1 Tax=Legionella beliardensis TaxID=91822 RepID=A0A378HYJ7_9GAMM|nr:MFS transporter [Legionella beliardensis]STX27978.1 multidrug efflux system protein [Legionella beliardensis]
MDKSLPNMSTMATQKWGVLTAMSISFGMTLIDQSGIALALTKIQQTFNISSMLLQWVTNGYYLTLAVFLVIGGRLGDLFAHYRVFLIGLWVFLIASLICALAMNIAWLISGRLLQGLGAALILPNTAVIILNVFPENERGKAMGIYMGSALLFTPVAFILGGVFTQYVSWRLLFYLNLPLFIICLWILKRVMKSFNEQPQKKKLDWQGLITFSLSISLLIFAVMESSTLSLPTTLTLFFLSCFLFLAFYYLQQYQHEPLIRFHIFRYKLLRLALVLFFCTSFSMIRYIFDAIFFEQVLGFNAAMAGLLFLPHVLCLIIAAPLSGKVFDQYGYRPSILGGLLFAVFGLILQAIFAPYQNYIYLLPGIICFNFAIPFILSSINTAVLSAVELHERGIISGIMNATRQITSSLSLAILTSIIVVSNRYFLQVFLRENTASYPSLSLSQFEHVLINKGAHLPTFNLGTQQINFLVKESKIAFTQAYSISIWTCAVFVAIALLFTLNLLKNEPKLGNKLKPLKEA